MVESYHFPDDGRKLEIALDPPPDPGQVVLAMNHHGFCIFINTVFQGPVPSVRGNEADDSDESRENICVFATEREAQLEIADFMMTRLREFIDGERDFEDAMTVEEYIVEVDVCPDGTIIDADGNCFRRTVGD